MLDQNNSIDFDDAPELTDADLSRAVYKVAGQTVSKADWQQSAREKQASSQYSVHCGVHWQKP